MINNMMMKYINTMIMNKTIRHKRRRKFSPNLEREDTIRVTKVIITVTMVIKMKSRIKIKINSKIISKIYCTIFIKVNGLLITNITICVRILSFSFFRLTCRQGQR